MELTDKRTGFTKINHFFINGYLKFLNSRTIKVYLALRSLESKGRGFCFPSYRHLSDMTGLSIKESRNEIDRMIKFNMITKESGWSGKKRKRNIYFFCPRAVWKIRDKRIRRLISQEEIDSQWSNRKIKK